MKKGDFLVAFYCCLPQADDLRFENYAAENLGEVNKRDLQREGIENRCWDMTGLLNFASGNK